VDGHHDDGDDDVDDELANSFHSLWLLSTQQVPQVLS